MGTKQAASKTAVTFPVDDVQPLAESMPFLYLDKRILNQQTTKNVIACPAEGRRIVASGQKHGLIAAVHTAYARHLPLSFSPDAIWLVLVQGFSHHITENAEKYRSRLVSHQGKQELTQPLLGFDLEAVARAVAGFSQQIRQRTDPAIHDALVSQFTTTTPEIRVASEIALMDTYHPFFDYICHFVCGIPTITLQGTLEDWIRIRERAEIFSTFEMEWWLEGLRPILDQFVRAAEGKPNREFWRAIYKYRSAKNPYGSDQVTGWILNFFPYLGDAPSRRRNSSFIGRGSNGVVSASFPSGLTSVEVNVTGLGATGKDERKLELVGGFFAVQQNDDSSVAPMISWCLAEVDDRAKDVLSQLPWLKQKSAH